MSEPRLTSVVNDKIEPPKTFLQKLLDGVERVGNKVPHPAVIFFILIALVILLSHLFHWLGTTVTYEVINPQTHKVEEATATVNSLLTADGVRFMLTSMVRNFTSFGPVGIILVVMIGVGLAEQAGLINALIKKIVSRDAAQGGDLDPGDLGGVGEYCRRCRLPGPDPARSRGLPQPRSASAGRAGGGIRRGRCGIRRQFSDRADRSDPDGNHQRRDPYAESDALHRSDGEFLFRRGVEPGADRGVHRDHRTGGRATARRISGRNRRPRAAKTSRRRSRED